MQGLQSFMYTMLTDSSPIAARMSLDIIIVQEEHLVRDDLHIVCIIVPSLYLVINVTINFCLYVCMYVCHGSAHNKSFWEYSDPLTTST